MVAGIRCIEVLERLSDYLDGDVTLDERTRIEAHLRGCDQCERFGGRMSSIVKTLRETLKEPEPLEDGVARRLQDRLKKELGIT
jgi:anti-sigma factor RsiW